MAGRRLSNPEGLPARVYRIPAKTGRLYYIDRAGHSHPLGAQWDREARSKWLELDTGERAGSTFGDLLDRYLAECERGDRVKKSARTVADYAYEAVRPRKVFGAMMPAAISSSHIAQYLWKHPHPVRGNREAALISSVFSWAMATGEPGVERNPCYGVRRNPEQPRRRHIRRAELAAFLRHCPDWLRAYCVMKHLTGLRQGDLLKLTRAALTDAGLVVVTGKTGKELLFRWSWGLRTVVRAALQLQAERPTLLLFPAKHRGRYSTTGFKSAWQRAMNAYCAAGGERFWEHDIRARTGYDSKSLADAQERLGHASARTTQGHYRRGPAKVTPLR